MASYLELDIDSVARIGLMFLDGDALENILLDRYGHPDYDFDHFNSCKITLLKLERMNPTLGLTAVLWQLRPDNEEMAVPVAAGTALPLEGYRPCPVSPALGQALAGEFGVTTRRSESCSSHYYPVRNSDGEIVGALELLEGLRPHVDI